MAVGELMSGRQSVVRWQRRVARDARENILHKKKKTAAVGELMSGRESVVRRMRRTLRNARGSIHH